MADSVRTTFLTKDPDYGSLVLGFFQETPFYTAVLATGVTTPLITSNVLLYDPPADMNGSDYLEASAEATLGNTVEANLDQTFTFIQTKAFSFAGILQAHINATIDLDQADSTYGGAARLETILVELLKYNISAGTTSQIGILTHTVNKDIAGIVNTAGYAEPSLTEIFYFDVGISPKIEIGQTPGYLLQMRVKLTFSAYTNALATVNTIAKCRLNCYRDLSQNTILKVPII